MIADAFHHRRGARVSHRESLSGDAVEIGLAASGAIQNGIADQDVFLRQER